MKELAAILNFLKILSEYGLIWSLFRMNKGAVTHSLEWTDVFFLTDRKDVQHKYNWNLMKSISNISYFVFKTSKNDWQSSTECKEIRFDTTSKTSVCLLKLAC